MAKTAIDKLGKELERILQEYAEGVTASVSDAVEEAGKAGARAIRANAKGRFKGSGKYAKSWKSKVERGRMFTKATVHSSMYRLPHLLENGHAKRGGGRVPGRVHIAPVEQEISEKFTKALRKAVAKA